MIQNAWRKNSLYCTALNIWYVSYNFKVALNLDFLISVYLNSRECCKYCEILGLNLPVASVEEVDLLSYIIRSDVIELNRSYGGRKLKRQTLQSVLNYAANLTNVCARNFRIESDLFSREIYSTINESTHVFLL
jgi:hypothetical protein